MLLRDIGKLKNANNGRVTHWRTDLAALKATAKALRSNAQALAAQFIDGMLRPVAHWVARRVVEAAEERARTGELEFHDLLVLSPRLLRADASIRASLQARYRYVRWTSSRTPTRSRSSSRCVCFRSPESGDLWPSSLARVALVVRGDTRSADRRSRIARPIEVRVVYWRGWRARDCGCDQGSVRLCRRSGQPARPRTRQMTHTCFPGQETTDATTVVERPCA